MDMQDFIEKFAEAIEMESVNDLKEDTKFRELDEWNSLAVLSVIAMLDEEYDIQIENADFKKLEMIGDIAQFIENQR
ncbi:acyl carrier protein [Bacteroides sp. CACC 737]|jgi:acyl carrier protein|uniref:acyl carrier protein n=1 Tax=Bacteroides TaxID=816 RepID=UPI0015EF9ACC|nr:acyl carrier protein [Bacteroides sp. CACC 737]QMI80245.1 acyl carrier protein [Bacteroides sp. CACC 737]